jgi:GNAT superfamily N-acetyltransferase
MSQIRFATSADIPELVQLGLKVHAETTQASLPFSPDRLTGQLNACLTPVNQKYCILAAESDGAIVGVIWGYIAQHYFSEAWVATEYMFYVLPEFRGTPLAVRLLHAFRKWAENRGAAEVMICMTTGVDVEKFDRFLRKMKFDYVGGNFSMRLKGAAV